MLRKKDIALCMFSAVVFGIMGMLWGLSVLSTFLGALWGIILAGIIIYLDSLVNRNNALAEKLRRVNNEKTKDKQINQRASGSRKDSRKPFGSRR